MNTAKLSRLSLALVTTLMLSSVVRADSIINYTISGGTGGWSGQFDVSLLSVSASDLANTLSVSKDGVVPVTVNEIQINNWALYDNGWTFPPGYVSWLQRPPGEDATVYGLTVSSASLFTDVAGGNTWSYLISHGAYEISTTVPGYSYAEFSDSSYTTSHKEGGWITFSSSDGGVSSVPEPSSFAMLAIGGLVLGGYAWRKKKLTA